MYAKVFNQIFDSSIADDYRVRQFFVDLLVLADMNGVVDMTANAISGRTRMPIEIVKEFLTILQSPDPQSRTPVADGRRIVLLDEHRSWGWCIVNYSKFRAIASEEQRREKTRERMARFRENGGGPPDGWNAIRAKILKLDKFTCGYCGDRANEVDHIIPQSRGGDESDMNLVACCRKCNNVKNNRTPKEAGFKILNHRVTLCDAKVTQGDARDAMQKQKQSVEADAKAQTHFGECVSTPAQFRAQSEALKVLVYFNERTGRPQRQDPDHMQMIAERLLSTDVSVEGCKVMIDRKIQEWKGTHLEASLKITTLFQPGKFGDYYADRAQPLPPRNGEKPRGKSLIEKELDKII